MGPAEKPRDDGAGYVQFAACNPSGFRTCVAFATLALRDREAMILTPGDHHVIGRFRPAPRAIPAAFRPVRRGACGPGRHSPHRRRASGLSLPHHIEDAPVGETVLLLNYEHQPADTPYRARHAIFVRESSVETRKVVDEIPASLAVRPFISLRAFDAQGMMLDAEVVPGSRLSPRIERLLALPGATYLHAHFAGRGCYAACIARA